MRRSESGSVPNSPGRGETDRCGERECRGQGRERACPSCRAPCASACRTRTRTARRIGSGRVGQARTMRARSGSSGGAAEVGSRCAMVPVLVTPGEGPSEVVAWQGVPRWASRLWFRGLGVRVASLTPSARRGRGPLTPGRSRPWERGTRRSRLFVRPAVDCPSLLPQGPAPGRTARPGRGSARRERTAG